MKRYIKIIIGSLFIVCVMLGLGYLGLSVYYENGFSIQTYINGIYCTGKSVEAVNKELNDNFTYDGLSIKINNECFYIDAEEIHYEYDYREPLNHYLKQQNPFLWIENLIGNHKEYQLFPAVTYDELTLERIVGDIVKEQNLPSVHEVTLQATEDGFLLVNTKENVLDESKLARIIENALLEGKDTINLAEEDCFYDMAYTSQEEELMAFYDLVNDYQSRQVAYHFGEEKENFDAGDLAKTLSCYSDFVVPQNTMPDSYKEAYFLEENFLKVDEQAVGALLEEKFAPYNTYRNHAFTTHDGRVLTIKGGTYGNLLNMKKEKKEFTTFLSSDVVFYDREPEYIREVGLKGKDDIGDTYIEVDIGQQKMFYYRDGELFIETDVVTGKNNATREEVCYVYGKQRNRVLKGPGYASPVKYWMPVSGGIGIHDASWRSEYGGDIYIKNGSHGCINTPLEVVEKMYEVMEVGTPCILYYGLEEEVN
jgi:hypothetical protein